MPVTEPSLALVVSTLGRIDALNRLLQSVATQLEAEDSLIIVAQNNVAEVTKLANSINTVASISVLTSERGATLGRNTGAFSTGSGDVLIFPNDTTWFPEGSLKMIRASMTEEVLVYTVRDESGPKFRFSERTDTFTYRTVWDVIEPGFAIRRSVFDSIGGFDPNIGTGAPTPWQAGEVADLLYRWKQHNPAGLMCWRPKIEVCGVTDSAGLNTAERRRKLRAYGRGCGRIMTMYHTPLWFRAAYVIAGLLVSVQRPTLYIPTDGWSAAFGRFEGLIGKIWGGGFRAVSR